MVADELGLNTTGLRENLELNVFRARNAIAEHPRVFRAIKYGAIAIGVIGTTLRLVDQYNPQLIGQLLGNLFDHNVLASAGPVDPTHAPRLVIGSQLGCTIDPVDGLQHMGITESAASPIPNTSLFSVADTIHARQFVDFFRGTSARNTFAIPSGEIHPANEMFKLISTTSDQATMAVRDACGTGPERITTFDLINCYVPDAKCVDLGGVQNGAILQQLTVTTAK